MNFGKGGRYNLPNMKRLIYIDESGTASFSASSLSGSSDPWLILAAVVISQSQKRNFQNRVGSLKQKYLGIAGNYAPLHWYDLVKDKFFWSKVPLQDKLGFIGDYMNEVLNLSPDLIISVVDKAKIRTLQGTIYEYSLGLILERLQWRYPDDSKDLICEGRQPGQSRDGGPRLNEQLQFSYDRYLSSGVALSRGQKRTELKHFNPTLVFATKRDTIAPLELADAVAFWINIYKRGGNPSGKTRQHFYRELRPHIERATNFFKDRRSYKEFP